MAESVARHGATVHISALSKTFTLGGGNTVPAVDNVTVSVEPGTAVGLTGPSGSGKSTLLHLIGAIDSVDTGSIRVDDTDVTARPIHQLARYRRTLGFVFQRYNLLAALTAEDNVVAPVLPYRTDFDKRARARELLTAVGLEGREGSLPSELSGGQQQRVAIARALINRPALLLADEPTGNLDSHTSNEIVDLLLQLRSDHGATLIIATHENELAARCDRVLSVRDGRITHDTAPPSPSRPTSDPRRETGRR